MILYDIVKITCRGGRRETIKRGIRSYSAACSYASACYEEWDERCASSIEPSPVAVYQGIPDVDFEIVEREG